MYRGSSPIFDVPEFPVLRRVKPLPKRRRTSSNTTPTDADVVVGSVPVGNGILLPPSLEGLVMPGPDATPEELLAHADQLSARMAHSSYYMPMLGGVPDFLNSAAAAMAAAGLDKGKGFGDGGTGDPKEILFRQPGDVDDNESEEGMIVRGEGEGVAELVPHDEDSEDAHSHSYTESHPTLSDVDLTTASLDYGMGYPIPGVRTTSRGVRGTGAEVGIVTSREDDDDHGDGDFMEHLQQPGNTKKRKVPANISNSPRGHDSGSTRTTIPDESIEQNGLSTGNNARLSNDYDTRDSSSYATTLSLLVQKKSKLTAATLAGLQHKEMLKTRKRQLAAVLGALSHGDTLALDQALSANYPINSSGSDDFNHSPKVRLSRRRVLRMARALRQVRKKQKPPNKTRVQIPTREFTFMCPSETADRLIATKEEVVMLRNRFEAELARQAAKAARLAATNKRMTYPPSKSGKSKRTVRHQNQHTKQQQQSQQQSQHQQPQPQEQGRRTSNRGGTNREKDQGASTMNDTTTVGAGAIDVGGERRQNMGVNMTASSDKEQLQHVPSPGVGRSTLLQNIGQMLKAAQQPTASSTSTAPQVPSEAVDNPSPTLNARSTRGKKKKRSALANASNPHHLKNYVPSRLPHSGSSNYQQQLQQAGYNSNWITPLPLRFLMADIPPRKPYVNPPHLPLPSSAAVNGRGKKSSNGTQRNTTPPPTQQSSSNNAVYNTYDLANPADEWICAFCEYELFYGDELGYRRAIRNRKKILKRRRRARERAAAAARGAGLHSAHHGAPSPPLGSTPIGDTDVIDDAEYNTQSNGVNGTMNNGYSPPVKKGHEVDDEEYEFEGDEGYDPIQPDGIMTASNSTKRKGAPNKEREREQTGYG